MNPRTWRHGAWAVLLSLLTLTLTFSACGGGGGSSGSGTGSTGSVVSISISATSTSIALGQTTTVSATPVDALGNLVGVSLTWQSSNTLVATVSNGEVTGVAEGTTTISVSAGGITSNLITLTVTAPITGSPGDPTLGAHGLVFHISNGSVGPTLSTPAMTTQSGSTMLAFVGKGSVFLLSPPTDNKGNTPYVQVGSIHEYTRWPGEGTTVYAYNSIVGGANHIVSIDDSNRFDEVTFATVEVRNGGVIQDLQWREVLNSAAQTSASVTTTGPATLVAVWYGDDSSSTPSRPVPNNGFTVIEGVGNAVETVQMFVATRNVSAAGTYNVTWNTTPLQGAQLYLVAVQKRP
jgi:Bacterial Ig-like domain (group 2)